jgi:heptosyltransferase-3
MGKTMEVIQTGTIKFGENPSRILLIQLGDIGDVVWATPTFRAVKEAYAQAEVSLLLREGLGSLVEADPHIHRIFEIPRREERFWQRAKRQYSLIRNVRRERFDLVVDLRLDDRGAFMALFTGALQRVSLIHRTAVWRNRLFTHLVDPPPTAQRIYGAAEQSLQIVRACGVQTGDHWPKLWVDDETEGTVRCLLDREGISVMERWISINPFARWTYKEWDDEKWIRLVDWLWEEHTFAVVIVGSSKERERAACIKEKSRGTVFNLAGRTTLGELVGVLGASSLHIGVDSAAPHIAAAVDTPTITIYGPSDWLDWSPQGANHAIIAPDRECAPCHQKGCDGSGRSACLEELTVERVREEIQKDLVGGIMRIHQGAHNG